MHQIYLLWQMLYNSEKKGSLYKQIHVGMLLTFFQSTVGQTLGPIMVSEPRAAACRIFIIELLSLAT